MPDNILQPDPEALHQSAIDILTHVSNVMEQGSTLLKEHDRLLAGNHSENRLGSEIKAVEQDLRYVKSDLEKVKSLELTLTIVAPMKAGKSTIINAITGQDLLPSRNDAMTILPTEIVFSCGVTQPKLIFDETLLGYLREAWRQLHEQIQQLGLEGIIDRIKIAFPRTELVKEIFSAVSAPFQSELEEPNSIKSALTKANDVLRLCNILDIPTDFLSSLPKIPRVEVPFPSQLSFSVSISKLVLVDTPGSNEANSTNLVDVVKDRLQASAMILLVLDYTQFKTTAAEDIKKVIDEIANVKGRDRIYIVINKIDERKNDEDLSSQQVLDLVRDEYQIEDPENRVFEISGREAFLAANFWRELNISKSATPQEIITSDALGAEYYGKSWENQQLTVTSEEMRNAAKKCWHDSGFDRFINTAIAPLVADDRPSSIRIKTVLKDTGVRLSNFQSCLERQKGILDRNIQQLRTQINQLKQDETEIRSLSETMITSQNVIMNRAKSELKIICNEEINNLSGKVDIIVDIIINRIREMQKDPFFFLALLSKQLTGDIEMQLIQEKKEAVEDFKRQLFLKISVTVSRIIETVNIIFDQLYDFVTSQSYPIDIIEGKYFPIDTNKIMSTAVYLLTTTSFINLEHNFIFDVMALIDLTKVKQNLKADSSIFVKGIESYIFNNDFENILITLNQDINSCNVHMQHFLSKYDDCIQSKIKIAQSKQYSYIETRDQYSSISEKAENLEKSLDFSQEYLQQYQVNS